MKAATAFLIIVAAALFLNACAEIEIVKIPAGDTSMDDAAACRERARTAAGNSYKIEGSCLGLIPNARTETATYQPGSPPTHPAGCKLLSVTRGRLTERWVYSCGQ